MPITHLADFSARIGSTVVPQTGFGTPLLVGYHSHFPELIKSYVGDPASILSAMEDDGFDTGENLYHMARRLLGQEKAPRTIKIGRLTTAPYQRVVLTPVDIVVGSVYTLTFENDQGSETITKTVTSPFVTAIAHALVTMIAGMSVVTAVSAAYSAGTVVVDATTGTSFRMLWDVNDRSRPDDMTLLDTSTGANIDTQLSAIEAADSDWYGLAVDVESVAIATTAAAWAATRTKLYLPNTSDSNAADSGTSTDIGSVVTTAANNRAPAAFSSQYRQGRSAALLGTMLPRQAGSATWANKKLRGDYPDDLTGAQYTTLQTKNYTTLRPLNATLAATFGGSTPGDYEWIDILQAFDWTEARCEEAIATLELSNEKIPFTVEGAALIRQALEKVVEDAIAQKVLSAGDPDNAEEDPVPAIVIPRIGEPGADAAARAARQWSKVKITGRFQGAVHSVIGELVFGF